MDAAWRVRTGLQRSIATCLRLASRAHRRRVEDVAEDAVEAEVVGEEEEVEAIIKEVAVVRFSSKLDSAA